MKRLCATSMLAAVLVVAVTSGTAGADAVYHSERLQLHAADDPGFRGQVVNIHANGPVIGALERYHVSRAAPDTTYAVWIQFCVDGFVDFVQTAELTTNKHGNGHSSALFTAADLDPFEGAVVDVRWVLKLDGEAIYWTDCTTVTID